MRFGPYVPPAVEVGAIVYDEVRGEVRVHDWITTGRMQWPRGVGRGRAGAPALILMDDLVRAIRREAATDVARHWGVTPKTVGGWRRALGVGRVTEGTRALLAEHGNPDIGRHSHRGAAALHGDPEASRARARSHAEALRRKPGWRERMKALARKRWER